MLQFISLNYILNNIKNKLFTRLHGTIIAGLTTLNLVTAVTVPVLFIAYMRTVFIALIYVHSMSHDHLALEHILPANRIAILGLDFSDVAISISILSINSVVHSMIL